jgi:DNA-binding SARP family transcriptional activator
MLPNPLTLLQMSAVIFVVFLLLPKRDWRSIPSRLHALAAGRRRYLFGPPARTGPLEADLAERCLQLARRETSRMLELGLPLFALAMLAEARGAQRRAEREQLWARSGAGLMFQHLAGYLSAQDLHAQLQALDLPLPAAKLAWTVPHPALAPPVSWRTQFERRLFERITDLAPVVPSVESAESAPSIASAAPSLSVRALGGLHLISQGEDLGPLLARRPVQGFIWLYLLVRQAHRPGDRVTRSVLADELFPGLDPEVQRRRLRQRLSELNGQLPKPLAERVKIDSEYLSLDLSDVSFDVRDLLELAGTAESAPELLPETLLRQIEAALPLAAEEFLPLWEETERRATNNRGAAGQLVAQVRAHLSRAHLTLLSAVANCYLARQQPQRAITHLEEGLRRHPEREDFALKLLAAYQQAGQHRNATKLREEFGLT